MNDCLQKSITVFIICIIIIIPQYYYFVLLVDEQGPSGNQENNINDIVSGSVNGKLSSGNNVPAPGKPADGNITQESGNANQLQQAAPLGGTNMKHGHIFMHAQHCVNCS